MMLRLPARDWGYAPALVEIAVIDNSPVLFIFIMG
jgi:hypothetical protein